MRLHNEYVTSIGSIHPKTGLPYAVKKDRRIIPSEDWFVDWLLTMVIPESSSGKKPEVG